MSTRERLWADYEAHHRSAPNRVCHLLGIPLIVAGLVSLLAVPVFRMGGFPVEAAVPLIIAAGAGFLWLDTRLGLAMTALTAALYILLRGLAWPWGLGLLAAGWIFQFIGHGHYEKRSPAFFQNFAHLLVGPLWALNHVLPLRRGSASR